MITKHLLSSILMLSISLSIFSQDWDENLQTLEGQQEHLNKLIQAANSTDLNADFYDKISTKLNDLIMINPTCENLNFSDEKINSIEDLLNRLENWKYVTTYLWFARFQDITSDELEMRIRQEISCNYYDEPLSPKQNTFLRKWFQDYDKNGYNILTFRKLNCGY